MAFLTYWLIVVPMVMLRGWALSLVWNWFLTTTVGVRSINSLEGIGISLVISVFTQHLLDTSKTVDEPLKIIESAIETVVITLCLLGMSWFVHYLMVP